MAEAAVETRPPNKFFCHQCTTEISPNLPEYTCPQCQSGFIEEITGEREDLPSQGERNNLDPAAQFAELFSQSILQSFSNLDREPHNSDDEFEDDTVPPVLPFRVAGPTVGARPNPFLPAVMRGPMPGTRISIRTHNPAPGSPGEGGQQDHRNMALQNILQSILSGLLEGSLHQQGAQFPFGGMLSMYGNPGDYAWGNGGLDNIITQLLNQIEGTGPPPADKDQIEQLAEETIAPEHIERGLQCSVCMDDFKLDEKVKSLPCEHKYHPDCILPWLELHGTCPVCRKTLSDQTSPNDSQTSRSPSSNQGPASRTRNHRPRMDEDEYD